jgi:hypothetical protein
MLQRLVESDGQSEPQDGPEPEEIAVPRRPRESTDRVVARQTGTSSTPKLGGRPGLDGRLSAASRLEGRYPAR